MIVSAPGGGLAGRPEYRVFARSKLPQKKWTGDVLPRNRARCRFMTTSTRASRCQNRCACAPS